ncbi:hypothetical protein [Sulfurimonas sp.]
MIKFQPQGSHIIKAGGMFKFSDLPSLTPVPDVIQMNTKGSVGLTVKHATTVDTNNVQMTWSKGEFIYIDSSYEYIFSEECVITYGKDRELV